MMHMQVVLLEWVRVEAGVALLPFVVSQGIMISTLSGMTHPMVVNLDLVEREAIGPSLRRLHVPNIMMNRQSIKGMIMAMDTTLDMILTTSTLDCTTMGIIFF